MSREGNKRGESVFGKRIKLFVKSAHDEIQKRTKRLARVNKQRGCFIESFKYIRTFVVGALVAQEEEVPPRTVKLSIFQSPGPEFLSFQSPPNDRYYSATSGSFSSSGATLQY